MRLPSLLCAATGLALLAGCAPPSSPATSADGARPEIVAGLYPLAFVAEHVGGDLATVTTLAAPGVEPHDVELSPAAVRSMSDADLVLYINGFQPSVDDAVATAGVDSLDAASVVALRDTAGGKDPHFWLDPLLLADYGHDLATELSRIDPANADQYRANAKSLYAELAELDSAYAAGLAQCERRDIVTSHESLAYLADAYDLNQVGVAGLDPHGEPSPARIREITALVESTGATTIFTESANGSSVVDTIADDAGLATDVLSPVETVADGEDYFAIMYRNLEALKSGLDCGEGT